MLIYLLRHADANTEAAADDERALSKKGLRQAAAAGRFCREAGHLPDLLLTSPLLRAQQTAKAFATEAGAKEVRKAPFLRPGMLPAHAVRHLREFSEFGSVMLVGHEPDFSRLIAFLIGLPEPDRVHVRKASLMLLDADLLREGSAVLEFSVPPKLMLFPTP